MVVACFFFFNVNIFQSWCDISHFHQQWMSNPVSPHPHQHFMTSLYFSHSDRFKWYLIMVIICISLMAKDIKHLFMCLFFTYMSFLVKCVFMCFFFLIGFFLTIEFKSSLYILNTSLLSDMWFLHIFSQSVAYLFILPMGLSWRKKYFNSNIPNFPSMDHVFSVTSKNSFYIALNPKDFFFFA